MKYEIASLFLQLVQQSAQLYICIWLPWPLIKKLSFSIIIHWSQSIMFTAVLELNSPWIMPIQWANTYKTRAASITLCFPITVSSTPYIRVPLFSCVLGKATPATGLWCAQNSQNQGCFCFFIFNNFSVLMYSHNTTERTTWRNCFVELLGRFHRHLPLNETVYRLRGKNLIWKMLSCMHLIQEPQLG